MLHHWKINPPKKRKIGQNYTRKTHLFQKKMSKISISVTIFFKGTHIWVIFWKFSYGFLWTIPKTFSIVWLSLDISKDNSKNNYLIFKSNYLHPYNYFILSFSLLTNKDMKMKINMCIFMSMIYIYIFKLNLIST